VYLCVLCGSEKKTAIISLYSINWLVFITQTECVHCAVQTGSLHSASLTFSNSTFCPHVVFMCFVWIWEQTMIISLYSINWLVFITQTECVYCVVQTGSLYTASLIFSNSMFCPHSVFMCFVWIWEQTAIISLYSTNWPVFITETECVYCVVRTENLNTVQVNYSPCNAKQIYCRNTHTVPCYRNARYCLVCVCPSPATKKMSASYCSCPCKTRSHCRDPYRFWKCGPHMTAT